MVTITVAPDEGYQVAGVAVRDKNGNEIVAEMNADGIFAFEMPAGQVAVEPIFVWENSFRDVAESTYYAKAVQWAVEQGITQGVTAAQFQPQTVCNRGQIVTFLYRSFAD